MARYVLRRLLLIVPTLLGIMVVNFIVIQFAPGGPIEQIVAQSSGLGMSTTQAVSAGGQMATASGESSYGGAAGLPPEMLAELEKQFGFDKPAHERFFTMIWNYARLDFGHSYFQDRPVFDLVLERLPVSMSLGLWALFLIYLIAIPLAFVSPWISTGLYVFVALLWLVPDRRIERRLAKRTE